MSDPTDAQLASACLSFRHDFGLMPPLQQANMMRDALHWWRAITKELPDPVEPGECPKHATCMALANAVLNDMSVHPAFVKAMAKPEVER